MLYATEKGFTKIDEAGMAKALLSGADATGTGITYATGAHNFGGTVIPDIGWVISLSREHKGINIISLNVFHPLH